MRKKYSTHWVVVGWAQELIYMVCRTERSFAPSRILSPYRRALWLHRLTVTCTLQGQLCTQDLGGRCPTSSVEDKGQIEQGSGGGSPFGRGSAQFANGWNPYSYWVVMNVFSMELGIRLSFIKTSEFWGGLNPQIPLGTQLVFNVYE
jgi:hypothetical protein